VSTARGGEGSRGAGGSGVIGSSGGIGSSGAIGAPGGIGGAGPSGASTALARLRRARRALLGVLTLKALVWAALGAASALGAVLAMDVLIGLDVNARARLTPAPWIAGLVILAWHTAGPLRDALRATDQQVALWFERRLPSLRYALVTQVELGDANVLPALERDVAIAPLEAEVRSAARTALVRPALTLTLLVVLMMLLPAGAVGRVVAPAPGDILDRPGSGTRGTVDPLAAIVVRVQPPAYSGLATSAVDDPATVAALAGSRVTIEGRGRDVRGTVAERVVDATPAGDRWRLTLPMPERATAVTLSGATRERVLVLEPVPDSIPVVRLEAPARDSVFREATGSLTLGAELRDDLGLADGNFELIISAGGGELYSFRTVRAGARQFAAGVRTGPLSATLRLDTLGLKAGDMIHVRAVARDRNDVTGPGRGASETRTLRIARADEYDSVSVEALPPTEPEKGVLSQRMILLQTQELVAKISRLSTNDVARESRLIAVDQTKLRKRVGEVVFMRLGEDDGGEHAHFAGDGHEHGAEGILDPDVILAAAERAANAGANTLLDTHGDESPVVAINRPLLEAYNHMWRASTELETASPAAAIPWMERAIAALQAARAAERIYLRGRPPRVVVDLARVRLIGKDEANPAPRSPRVAVDPIRAQRLARFDAALSVVQATPEAAADSMLVIRVTLPPEERGAALALDAAAVALRRGGDVTLPLAAARRALVDEPPRRSPLTPWGM
jgi:hypothetical protein